MGSARFLRGHLLIVLSCIVGVPAATASVHFVSSQTPMSPSRPDEESLRKYLQGHLKEILDVTRTRYAGVSVDLNGDSKEEIVVYLMGPSWCGSGGCTILILSTEGATYRVHSEVTVSQTPVRKLRSKSHGWHDLGIWVSGGGEVKGFEAILRFDGEAYPSNPTVPPAERTSKKLKGELLFGPNLTGLKPLFP